MSYAIYGLVDPRDRKVFYVGQSKDVYRRFVDHISCSGNNFERNAQILELRALNLMVIMEVFETVESKADADNREAYWVAHFQRVGQPLANIALINTPKNQRKEQLKRARAKIMQVMNIQTKEIAPAPPAKPIIKLIEGEIFTAEQEHAILLAVAEISQSGKKLTRGAIKTHLGWNNAKYDILKAICDKNRIA